MVSSPAGQSASYVIGYDPSARHAGPSRLVGGRQPGAGEAIVDGCRSFAGTGVSCGVGSLRVVGEDPSLG
jgi:putative ABC transport system permease protein